MHHPWLIARDARASAACNTFLQQHLNIATLNCKVQNAHFPPICAVCALCSAQWRVASAGHSGPNYLLHHQCSPRQERKGAGLQLNCSWARRRRGSRWQEQGIVCSPFQCIPMYKSSQYEHYEQTGNPVPDQIFWGATHSSLFLGKS